jgi:choline-glycine betaine transporter
MTNWARIQEIATETTLSGDDLYELIKEMKPVVNSMQLKPWFTNFRTAFNLLPINFTASSVETLEQIVTNITSMSKADEALKWAWVVCLVLAPVAMVIVAYLVIVMGGQM